MDEQQEYKPKNLRLVEMPQDVYALLIKEQAHVRASRGVRIKLETIMYRIIRKYMALTGETQSGTEDA